MPVTFVAVGIHAVEECSQLAAVVYTEPRRAVVVDSEFAQQPQVETFYCPGEGFVADSKGVVHERLWLD